MKQPIRAFIFPGLGNQKVGMGESLAAAFPQEAGKVFRQIDEALDYDLTGRMLSGPQDELNQVENALPARFAFCMAVVEVLKRRSKNDLFQKPNIVLGHSLGEYAALAAAGSFEVPAVADLLYHVGRVAEFHFSPGISRMAVLRDVPWDQAKKITAHVNSVGIKDNTYARCYCANHNAVDRVVISGNPAALGRALNIVASLTGRKNLEKNLLPVSVPFHSPLVGPLKGLVRDELAALSLSAPLMSWISNATADIVHDVGAIPGLLLQQVDGPVLWLDCVRRLRDYGVQEVVEIAPDEDSNIIARKYKQENSDINFVSLNSRAQIEEFLKKANSNFASVALRGSLQSLAGAKQRTLGALRKWRPSSTSPQQGG